MIVRDVDKKELKSTKDTEVKVYGFQRCQEWATLNLGSDASLVNPTVRYNGMWTPAFPSFSYMLYTLILGCTSSPRIVTA